MAFPFAFKPLAQRPALLVSIGNRCGHDPKSPRFDCIQDPAAVAPDESVDAYGKAFRPLILRDLGVRLRELFHAPKKHVSWCFHHVGRNVKANGANLAQVRSESREARVAVMAVMALNMDLVTMRVGYSDKAGKFNFYTTKWLAQQAGVSLDRAKAVIRWMRDEGVLIGNGRVYERAEDGTYRGKGSPKLLSEHLFSYFGLFDWLKEQREKASARARARREEAKLVQTREQQAVSAMRHSAMMSAAKDFCSGVRSTAQVSKAERQAAEEAGREAAAAAIRGDFSALHALLA